MSHTCMCNKCYITSTSLETVSMSILTIDKALFQTQTKNEQNVRFEYYISRFDLVSGVCIRGLRGSQHLPSYTNS